MLIDPRYGPDGVRLHHREIAALAGAADGETAAVTADRLHYSRDAIRRARRRAMRALGARTIAHAVAVAIRRGLIQ